MELAELGDEVRDVRVVGASQVDCVVLDLVEDELHFLTLALVTVGVELDLFEDSRHSLVFETGEEVFEA